MRSLPSEEALGNAQAGERKPTNGRDAEGTRESLWRFLVGVRNRFGTPGDQVRLGAARARHPIWAAERRSHPGPHHGRRGLLSGSRLSVALQSAERTGLAV